MIIPFIVFAISLIILLFAARIFTETAEKIGLFFNISPFIIGVIIVAIGTSLPEIATSIIAVINNHSEMVIGNVVGSNFANILLVLAITAIIGKQLNVNKDVIKIDLPILLASAILLYITTMDGTFSKIDGLISLSTILTYIIYNISSERDLSNTENTELKELKKQTKKEKEDLPFPIRYFGLLIISGIILYFSSEYTVSSIIEISEIFNIGSDIVAMSLGALGNTLPELSVSIYAAIKGKADMAIGNITGSNIFNALGVMGISSLVGNLEISVQMIAFTIPTFLLITILYMFVIMDKQITRWEGITLLFIYIAFIGKSIGLI